MSIHESARELLYQLNKADVGTNPEITHAKRDLYNWAKTDAPDPRWRPMSSAPRDGTVVEGLCSNRYGTSERIIALERGAWRTAIGGAVDAVAWRPAHPEWNAAEEPTTERSDES